MRQLDLAAGAPHPPGVGLDPQVGEEQRRRFVGVVVGSGAAQQGAHPGEQLVELERLGQVVVGAGIEPGDTIGRLGARREHQDRQAVALGTQHPAHREPVDVGHHHVEDRRVGMLLLDHGQRRGAVGRLHDLVALQAEGAGQRSRIARSSSARRMRPLVIESHSARAAGSHATSVARWPSSEGFRPGPARRGGSAPRRTGLDLVAVSRWWSTGSNWGSTTACRPSSGCRRAWAHGGGRRRAAGKPAGSAVVDDIGDPGRRLGEPGVGLGLGELAVGDRLVERASWWRRRGRRSRPGPSCPWTRRAPQRGAVACAVRTSSGVMPSAVATVSSSITTSPRLPGPPVPPGRRAAGPPPVVLGGGQLGDDRVELGGGDRAVVDERLQQIADALLAVGGRLGRAGAGRRVSGVRASRAVVGVVGSVTAARCRQRRPSRTGADDQTSAATGDRPAARPAPAMIRCFFRTAHTFASEGESGRLRW